MSAPNHRYSVKHVLRGTIAAVRARVKRCGGTVTTIGLCASGFTYGAAPSTLAPRRVRGKKTRPAFVGGYEHPVVVHVVATREQHYRIDHGDPPNETSNRKDRRAAWEATHTPPVRRTP